MELKWDQALGVASIESDIVELVRREVLSIAGKENTNRYQLSVQPKDLQARAFIDVVKIREVVSNLLTNADQYSPQDTSISVQISKTTESVQVLVIDQGIGMTRTEQKRAFEKFYRSDAAKKVRPTGSGVGLYMSKEVIEAHNGEVLVTSKKSQGSSIGFRIPLKKK